MGEKEKTNEKEVCGCKISTIAKLINVCLGILMIFYSIFTFFSVAWDMWTSSPVIVITFRVYEM